jgi:hypothetical protein
MTLPHTLAIIERAARELREDIVHNIPFSHRLSLGTVARAKDFGALLKRHEGWFRAGRAILAPQSALVAELRRAVVDELAAHGSERVQTWLLREYIRKLGYHAIDLYGGLVRIEDAAPLELPDPRLAGDGELAGREAASRAEPLRILLLGRANAGKSSLVNALFGELTAATDLLPDTTAGITPYRLERDGDLQALVFDTPGFDGPLFGSKALARTARDADLVLWVTAADRAERGEERERLDALRSMLSSDPSRRVPPLAGGHDAYRPAAAAARVAAALRARSAAGHQGRADRRRARRRRRGPRTSTSRGSSPCAWPRAGPTTWTMRSGRPSCTTGPRRIASACCAACVRAGARKTGTCCGASCATPAASSAPERVAGPRATRYSGRAMQLYYVRPRIRRAGPS